MRRELVPTTIRSAGSLLSCASSDDLMERGFPHFAHPQYNKARDIRRAIRAAIGSDKA